ncbi:hypothetical protein [Mycolicibacterium tokaiense]|uniref:hypothetical protein n=1 Tax=Mycolicibacterium tokaiense TaxID=39695 RepID=UPI00138C141B|nr:hypothetical protein [Mycolicibacterium tokaiense]BBY88228.1 LppW family protein [Mycolicibacterium tokaiense]
MRSPASPQARASNLVKGTVVAVSAALIAGSAGCEARVYGSPGHDSPMSVVVPQAPAETEAAAPIAPPMSFTGLQGRADDAVRAAADQGADIGLMVLDRETRQQVSAGRITGWATASVVKLFIADDLLLREPNLSPDDRALLDVMLRSSDDSAAETFWNRGGGSAIVDRVTARYGLRDTSPPNNGRWFNTITSAADLVRYYDMMLAGTGGLPRERASIIMSNLAASTPTAPDGTQPGGIYPQRFGIPEGLPAERVAVKQGWMCCIGGDWMHLSTGVLSADRRYIMVIYALQPVGAEAARETITAAVRAVFPTGRV